MAALANPPTKDAYMFDTNNMAVEMRVEAKMYNKTVRLLNVIQDNTMDGATEEPQAEATSSLILNQIMFPVLNQ